MDLWISYTTTRTRSTIAAWVSQLHTQLLCSLCNEIYLSYKLKANQALISIWGKLEKPFRLDFTDGDCSVERKLKETWENELVFWPKRIAQIVIVCINKLWKQKNSEGEMYSFNWYHTEPSLKFFITSTKYANLGNSQCYCSHTLICIHTVALVDNNEAKRQFFPRFWIIGTKICSRRYELLRV